jgi:hypothetical protein
MTAQLNITARTKSIKYSFDFEGQGSVWLVLRDVLLVDQVFVIWFYLWKECSWYSFPFPQEKST